MCVFCGLVYTVYLYKNVCTDKSFLKTLLVTQGQPGESGERGPQGDPGQPGSIGQPGNPGVRGEPGEQGDLYIFFIVAMKDEV